MAPVKPACKKEAVPPGKSVRRRLHGCESDHGADFSIEHAGDSDLFGGGLSVHIHKNNPRADADVLPPSAVRRDFQVLHKAPLEIHHRNGARLAD
jgi:hypothetical protein